MDYLDKFLHPQSLENLQLFKYLLGFCLFVLIPYLSLISGFTLFSAYYYRKSVINKDTKLRTYASLLINSVTTNKISILGFGVLPIIGIVLILVQYLQNTNANINGLVLLSLILFLVGIVLIYFYKHSLNYEVITSDLLTENQNNSLKTSLIDNYRNKSNIINNYYPLWGAFFVLSSVFLFFAAIKIVTVNDLSRIEILNSVLSVDSLVYFLTFISFSILISLTLLSFIGDKIAQGIDVKFYEKNKSTLNKVSLILQICFSLLLLLNLVFSPTATLSNNLFLIFVLSIFVVALILIQTYLSIKSDVEYKNSIFFFTVLLTILFVSGSVSKFSTATLQKVDKVANQYITYEDEQKKALSVDTIKVDVKKNK